METNTNEVLDIKIRNNAMSAYFLIFLCASFLFVKHNPDVDNPFVRSHTKTALFLHTIILLIILIFIWFGLFGGVSWNDYHLNSIIASTLLIGMLGFLLKGMYLAHNGKEFIISEVIHFIKNEKILDINNDSHLDEKDKATIIFSLIPFLGIIIHGKYPTNATVKNLSFLSLLITLFLSLVYISDYTNAANFLLLLWVIGIVFFSIQVVVKGELLSLDLSRVPTFSDIYETIKLALHYVKNYFSKSHFKEWNILKADRKEALAKEETESETSLKDTPKMKLPHWLIYIPIVNFISLWNLGSNKRVHITNGLGITLVFIFALVVILYDWNYLFFFLFPMAYGFAFLETKPSYKLPLFYDVGNASITLTSKIKGLIVKAHTIKKTENIVSLKVEEKK